MSLHDSLGTMRSVPQWIIYRLEWEAEKGKYKKWPCALDGSVFNVAGHDPVNWNTYEVAQAAVERLRALPQCADRTLTYALGFWLTTGCGFFFLDLDACMGADGQPVPFALQLATQTFPGALVEYSSSLKGIHVIGRGQPPYDHRNKPLPDVARSIKPMELEFYTAGRGIAFGLSGEAHGSADAQFDVKPLCDAYFPERPAHEHGDGPRAEWKGPVDDDVLIDKMLNARASAQVAFGGRASAAQLWRGEVEKSNEHDMALAARLAFWTGCDAERIQRLMLRSGLVRDKWFDRRRDGTYLSFTIDNACAQCENVYIEQPKSQATHNAMYGEPLPLPGLVIQTEGGGGELVTVTHVGDGPEPISAETYARMQELKDQIAACGDELEMHNKVIPAIRAAGVPGALRDQMAKAVNKMLKFWGAELAIADLRKLISPPNLVTAAGVSALPDWAKDYCFVLSNDKFFNTRNATELSMVGFQAAFGRNMPINDQGRRENPAEKCLNFWEMPVVERVGYMPGAASFYEWDGVQYANLYSPSSVPLPTPGYTQTGVDGIAALQAHMFDMCGRRQDVFEQLIYWFAHNVQQPGRKIRWSPIIKGVHGDGKTLISYMLRSAMGYRNVTTTSNSNISNSGGFTDWAVRGAVNIIEEIMLTGKERHKLYNSMKEFITNDIVDINPKGGKAYTTHNHTNHYAATNHNDALPMEPSDRRWFVVFTPWSSLDDMMRYCGLDARGWKQRTDAMDRAWRNCAGELRAWFLGVAIPEWFDIDGSAMMTPEKRRMMASSKDDAESAAIDIISNGAVGITDLVISSAMLSAQLDNRAQLDRFDAPKSTTLNHMLTRLGYSKMEKQVKWNNRSHSVWVKNGIELTNEEVRAELDRTALVGPGLPVQGSVAGLVAPTLATA